MKAASIELVEVTEDDLKGRSCFVFLGPSRGKRRAKALLALN